MKELKERHPELEFIELREVFDAEVNSTVAELVADGDSDRNGP